VECLPQKGFRERPLSCVLVYNGVKVAFAKEWHIRTVS
jgi:hypothetical protein